MPSPGNYDLEIADTLSKYTTSKVAETSNPEQRSLLEARAARWHERSLQMAPRNWRRRVNWWRDPYEVNGIEGNSTVSATNGTVLSLPSELDLPNSTSLDTY